MDFDRFRNYFFIVSLAGVSILFFYTIKPFIYPLFWAAVLASLFHPVYRWFQKFFDQKFNGISSLLTLLVVIIVILLPLALVSTLLVQEIINIYGKIGQGEPGRIFQDIINNLRHNELFSKFNVDDSVITQQLNQIGQSTIDFLYESAKKLTQNSLEFLALFVLMLYSLFFFLRDGEKIMKKVFHLFPLDDKYEKMLFNKFTSTVSATIKGNFIVGMVQGLTATILYWATGVPTPLVFGVLTGAAALIPGAGTFLVWFPVCLGMYFSGHVNEAIIIFAVGILVVSTIDNLIRPTLVGKDIKMHQVLVLFTTLGGVVLFGISGFVIGPVIAALFQSFWEIYEDYYHKEL